MRSQLAVTFRDMNSGDLLGSFLSTNTNAGAGDKTPNYELNPPFFIAFVELNLTFMGLPSTNFGKIVLILE